MTILYLKEFGKYVKYDEQRKAYIYIIGTRLYKIDRDGASRY